MTGLLEPAPGVDLARCIAGFGTPPEVDPRIEKDQADLDRYEQILATTRPGVLIECGSRAGASALWFAQRVPLVVTIDNNPQPWCVPRPSNVTRVIGDSTDPLIVAMLLGIMHQARCMVSLDSDHSRDHVKAEIAMYTDLVSPGCYLVIEDGIYHWRDGHGYDGDPLEAISAMMPARGDYVRDLDIEGRYPTTGAIAGWWRRRDAEVPFTTGEVAARTTTPAPKGC